MITVSIRYLTSNLFQRLPRKIFVYGINFRVIFVCIVFLSWTSATGKLIYPRRVYQGKSVSKDEYPYVMALIVKVSDKIENQKVVVAQRVCTCSLIKPDWILISAHCLEEYSQEFLRVVYDDLTIPPNTTKYRSKIRKSILHSDYFHYNDVLKNDIALLLIDPINGLPVGRLSAIDYKYFIGYAVTYVGAGGTYSLSSLLNEEIAEIDMVEGEDEIRPLQTGEAVVVPCDKAKALFRVVYPGICLHSKCSNRNQNVIPGDSGGPLLYKGRIIGVASVAGSGIIDRDVGDTTLRRDIGEGGSVYTAVSPYLDWINEVITNEKNCTHSKNQPNLKKHRKTQGPEAYFTII
ncbi:trypsin domain-containing protein [Phthorimaea operculella]|nr:trypsin domain-containing protein [Phthorimaea operculella]